MSVGRWPVTRITREVSPAGAMSQSTAESRFSNLFELIGDPVVEFEIVETEPIVRTVNPAFVETFGYDRADILGESLNEYIVPEDMVDEASKFDQRTKVGEYNSAEVTRITASEPRDFLYRGVPYERNGKSYGFAIYTDITDRNKRKEELKEYKQELEASNEKLERFAYIASHDLQEPLRMVSSYVGLLESELEGELDDETAQFMEFAIDGAERMRDMIDGLLTYSRVQTEAKPFELVDPNDVINEVRKDLELKIAETDATVDVGDLPEITADRNQLNQLFQNLIKNAIEHSDAGVRIEIRGTRRDGETAFSVADTGPGIPEYRQEDIFGIFDTGAESDGTGIGLAVCQEIVTRHGGDLTIDSTVDEGTTFRFTIPEVPG